VLRGIRNGQRAERMFRATRFNPPRCPTASPIEIHPSLILSSLLLLSIHSAVRVPLKDWPQPPAGRRPRPAGEAFLACRCKCFIRSSCSAATLHCIPTTRLQRSSVLRPRSCTPLLHRIYALALVSRLTQRSCGVMHPHNSGKGFEMSHNSSRKANRIPPRSTCNTRLKDQLPVIGAGHY